MKVTLFDWSSEGHHPIYVRRFAEALSKIADVAVAVPDETVSSYIDLSVQIHQLGPARPRPNFTQPLGPQNRRMANAELDLFYKVVSSIRSDHIIHLYSDSVIRRLVKRPSLEIPTTLCLFRPRAHYPTVYRTALSSRELLSAWFLEYLVARWRRRTDAHAIMTLDEIAARRWAKGNGAPAYYLPEPPVESLPSITNPQDRSGCIVYGHLARRKGIDLLANAVTLDTFEKKIVLSGAVDNGFERDLQMYVSDMEKVGAIVELRAWLHSEKQGLVALSKSRCVILPYQNHYGMSRVILEAATVGTPIIAHNKGLIGYLVRKFGLGIAVDCNNPRALRQAILKLCEGQDEFTTYANSLALFAERFSTEAFRQAIRTPFIT